MININSQFFFFKIFDIYKVMGIKPKMFTLICPVMALGCQKCVSILEEISI